MFNRGERERTRITTETAPYQHMAIDLEVDTKLQDQEFDLAIVKRHLLTSNDRLQLGTAYLYSARNRYTLANSIAKALTEADSTDLRGPSYSVETMTDFLATMYQGAKKGLEYAEDINSTIGFEANTADTRKFGEFRDGIKWLPTAAVSRNFIKGSIDALDSIWAHTSQLCDKTMSDTNVPNDFKLKLRAKLPQLLTTVENKRRAIERATIGGIESIATTQLLEEVYADIIATYRTLEEITSWLAMPRLHDSYFELREQYDETKKEGKKFDASTLGTSAVQQVISPSGKRFTLDSLNAPTPPGPSQPIRRFNPADLQQSPQQPIAPPQETPTSKPFKIDDINPSEAEIDSKPQGRKFDPEDLNAVQTSDPKMKRHFSPEDLDVSDS